MVPTGNTSEVAQQYYQYLWSQSIQAIHIPRTHILWSGPFWIVFWGGILILFFYLYSKNFQKVHRESGELYGAASFAGSILERIGRVASFSVFVWLLTVGAALFYLVVQTLRGQIY